jgi:predicted MFS family arabinose efflux permease
VIAGNWAVPLLERRGVASAAAGIAGGLILFGGIVTRPMGGLLAASATRGRVIALSLLGVATGAALLSFDAPYPVAVAGALVLGLAAGIPFALLFGAAQRVRPDAPGAAMALVNACAVLTILVGTPLAGLAFALPSDGALAFAAIAGLAGLALVALRAAPV